MSKRDASQASQAARLSRERKTVRAMIRLFCRSSHGGRRSLCSECQELQDYAMARLDRCVYGGDKLACSACPVHCYRPSMRERIQEVMRFSGPRMLLRHPLLAFWHLRDESRARQASGKEFDNRYNTGQNDRDTSGSKGRALVRNSSAFYCSNPVSTTKEGCHVTRY